jgi:O-acetyl-ADP-ribose deacetylase (regulator of RNase III)
MPINIFICYKKVGKERHDGTTIVRESKAGTLYFLLSQDKQYEPWMDQAALGGMTWETEIYKKILESDVLLLVVASGTSESEWVKREIALAKALGIAVVPLGVDVTTDQMVSELKELGVAQLQGKITQNIKLPPHPKEALLAELSSDLDAAALRTKKEQDANFQTLSSRRKVQLPKADDNKSAASFELKSNTDITFHIASGDLSKVRGVDAFVNSENDYMQMARVFESKTVSATLRRMGSHIRKGRYDDTIQHELDIQLSQSWRPVQCADVFVTSAGGPSSKLAKENKTRYILHVAAVHADTADARIVPFKQPYQISDCARSVLEKIAAVDSDNGIISPEGSQQRLEQEQRAEKGDSRIRSVIYPLFGTGVGGSTAGHVVAPMLDGILGFLNDADNQARNPLHIYLSAYTAQDVEDVSTFLSSRSDLVRK